MSMVSVAEASRRLGIDAKTLRRWLAEAQFPVQPHPHDGRKHGVSEEHLQTLARLHQRRLAPLPAEPPVAEAELSAVLLALPARLDALQAQLAALQQQVADLTDRHAPPVLAPVSPPAPAAPGRTRKHSAAPALATPHARPAAPPPRKARHVIPRVEYASAGHYVVICPQGGVLPFEPDSEEWVAWVARQDSFRFVGRAGFFSAHHEWRVPKGAWRAHRKIRNHLYIVRLAPNQELTLALLERAAAELQAHLSE